MDMKHVVVELQKLNQRAESDSGVLDDIRDTSRGTLNRLDSLVDAISGQVKADTQFKRDEALRRRQEAIRAGKGSGSSKAKDEHDGLLTSLIGFGVALKSGLFAIGAGLLFAANRYAAQFDAAMTETQQVIERVRETMVTMGALLGTPILRSVARLPFRIVSSIMDGIMWVIRSNIYHSAIIDAVTGTFTKMRRMPVFNMFNRFITLISNTVTWTVRMISRFIPGLNILKSIGGTILRTIGKAFPLFNAILIAFDGIMGGIRAWEQGGDVIDVVVGVFQGVVDGFINLFRDIGSFFGWITEKILVFMGVNEETAANVREGINNVFDAIANIAESMSLFANGITEDIARWIGRLFNNPNEVINNALSNIGTVMGDTLNAVGSFMMRSIKAYMGDILRMAANIIPERMRNIPGISHVRDSLIDMANNLSSDGLIDVNRDMFTGLANTVTSAMDGSTGRSQRAAIETARGSRGDGPRGNNEPEAPQTNRERITSPQSALSADEIGGYIPSQNFVTVMDNSSQSSSYVQQDNRATLMSTPASARNASYASFVRGD
jgi:hypothetical protein